MKPSVFFILCFLTGSFVMTYGFYVPNCRFLQKIKFPHFSFLSFFEKDENEKRKKEMEENKINVFRQYQHFNQNEEEEKKETDPKEENTDDRPLYTIVWYDCKECKELLELLEKTTCKTVFLDLTETVQEFKDMNNFEAIEKPFFYRNEDYLGDNLFDFYAHLYEENII